MALPTLDLQRMSITFTDGLENSSTPTHYVALGKAIGDDEVIAYYDKMAACSNAAAESYNFSYSGTDPTVAGSNTGAYITTADKATLSFQASDNSTVQVNVPAPKDACFGTDKKTVDKTNAAIAELVVAVLALIVTKGGKILVEYLKGKRTEGKVKNTKAGVVLHVP